jgi:hypothetical protein
MYTYIYVFICMYVCMHAVVEPLPILTAQPCGKHVQTVTQCSDFYQNRGFSVCVCYSRVLAVQLQLPLFGNGKVVDFDPRYLEYVSICQHMSAHASLCQHTS